MNKILFSTAIFGLLLSAVPAAAQEKPVTLDSEAKLVRIVEENGNRTTVLVDPEVVVPGDQIRFVTRYNNTGAETVDDFVVVNPVPDSIRVADESAAELEVSVDGGANWGKLASLTVAGEDGATRPVQSGDVTHIRWTIAKLEPGEAGEVGYSGIVE